jgi:hypothetical protein
MNKLLVFAFIIIMPMAARGQSAPTAATSADAGQSFSQFAADMLKSGRAVVQLAPHVKPAYAAYLPVWNFHAAYNKDASGKAVVDPYRQYFSIGGGGKYDTATKSGSGFIGCDVNAVALSARAWDFAWANDHVDRMKFPPIYGGVSYLAPTDYLQLRTMNLRRDLRYQFAISYPVTAFQTSSPNTP